MCKQCTAHTLADAQCAIFFATFRYWGWRGTCDLHLYLYLYLFVVFCVHYINAKRCTHPCRICNADAQCANFLQHSASGAGVKYVFVFSFVFVFVFVTCIPHPANAHSASFCNILLLGQEWNMQLAQKTPIFWAPLLSSALLDELLLNCCPKHALKYLFLMMLNIRSWYHMMHYCSQVQLIPKSSNWGLK